MSKNSSQTKNMTFIALLLATGIVFKAVTDSFMRTVFFFLMWDPLTIVNTCIFMKFKEKKYLFSVMIVETVLAATLFATTDIYFLRPLDVFVTYLVCNLIKSNSYKLKYFLSTFCSLLSNILIIFLLFLLFPNIISVDMTEVENLFLILKECSLGLKIFAGTFSIIVISAWVSIPSCLNMFFGKKISDITNKIVKI